VGKSSPKNLGDNLSQVAALYACHSSSTSVINQYRLLKSELPKTVDLTILYHLNQACAPKVITRENCHLFSYGSLSQLGYRLFSQNTLVPGSTHFPLIEFALKNPDYPYYWFIENDVRFSGNWEFFFNYWEKSQADLLTCHIRSYEEEPDWHWWGLKHPALGIKLKDRIRSFNTIYRVSKSAILHIHKMLLDGWIGHHEELIPTLLFHGGFRLEDMGGTGKFVSKGNKNLFYIDAPNEKNGSLNNKNGKLGKATMRWRPAWDCYGQLKDKLYHPVKN
jgi:hypothetical protein